MERKRRREGSEEEESEEEKEESGEGKPSQEVRLCKVKSVVF